MKTNKLATPKFLRKMTLPKWVQGLGKRFRHRDRGIYAGRARGS